MHASLVKRSKSTSKLLDFTRGGVQAGNGKAMAFNAGVNRHHKHELPQKKYDKNQWSCNDFPSWEVQKDGHVQIQVQP